MGKTVEFVDVDLAADAPKTEFVDVVPSTNANDGEKKSWADKHGEKVRRFMLALMCMMLLLLAVLGAMYYMQTLTEKDIREEIRKAVQDAINEQKRKESVGVLNNDGGDNVRTRYGEHVSDAMGSSSGRNASQNIARNQGKATSDKMKAASLHASNPSKVLLSSRRPWMNLRLPTNIVPRHYRIDLDVDMQKDVYKGNVSIDVNVTRATNVILLHNVGPKIDAVQIRKEGATKNEFDIRRQFSYEPNEFFVMELDSFLTPNSSYTITIQFHAAMRSELSGFYVSYYNDGKTRKKVASTFFSPISARTAFPCFDEPTFKANFTLSLTHSSAYKSHSHMLPASTCSNENTTTTTFGTTLKMSTYFLCWVIGDYKMLQNQDDARMRALTYTNDVKDVQFALETGTKLLNFYEEYFGIPYPLKKMDLVAVPSFGPGAMENWGIITFRSERILIGKGATEEVRQKSFNLVAHELTHQWFGNLATMKFWTDAWLKEGFANNIGTIGGHHVDSNMGSKEQVLSDWMLPTMELDSYSTSHPVSTNIKTSNDIRSIFDRITYYKGSCLVGLLHTYLGDGLFKEGLHKYLSKYAYGNANQDDLWQTLAEVSGKNVKAVMDTWTLQLGYPVVSMTRINASCIEVKQERFSLDPAGTIPPPSRFRYLWKIPLIFKSHTDDSEMMYLLEQKSAVFHVPNKFTLLNPNHAMFYRVMYDDGLLSSTKSLLRTDPDAFSAQDRTGIIDDQFSFVSAQMSDIGDTLDMLSYLRNERDFYPWKVALQHMSFIESLIESQEDRRKFNAHVQSLAANTVKNISWHKLKTINNGSLQVLLLNKACHSDTSEVYLQAKKYFDDWILSNHLELRPSLIKVMRDCVISVGPELYWDYVYLRYKHDSGSSRDELLWSLTSTTDVELVKKLLAYSIDNEKIDAQYTPYVISELSKNSQETRNLCWKFIKDNWALIFKRYGQDIFMLSDLLSAVLPRFSSEEDLKDIVDFFKDRDLGSAKNTYLASLRKIKTKISWKRNHYRSFKKWLDRQRV